MDYLSSIYNTVVNNQQDITLKEKKLTFASWQPQAVVNKRIQSEEKIKTNWGYRQYLQHNTHDIIQYNLSNVINDMGVSPYINGIDGNESDSDLKGQYLNQQQLSLRMV